jgi:hypothetical protein
VLIKISLVSFSALATRVANRNPKSVNFIRFS